VLYILIPLPQSLLILLYRFSTGQALESNFSTVAAAFKTAALGGDASNATAHEAALLTLLDDYDSLLSSDTNWMLGTWIAWARSWSDDKTEQDFFEFNARNQITLWGPTGQVCAQER
jgi:alpha-N-acetylglucosaminidase